jgi:hypothetical protein|tara:strand:+ start:904 stop:1134 length:231 start_codon:yes stop_codon:yes gene_type:complete
MERYKKIPSGHHRVKCLDYTTHNTLEIKCTYKGRVLNTDDLDIVLKEINENVGWGIFIEDIYWNDKHRCIEIEMGT